MDVPGMFWLSAASVVLESPINTRFRNVGGQADNGILQESNITTDIDAQIFTQLLRPGSRKLLSPVP